MVDIIDTGYKPTVQREDYGHIILPPNPEWSELEKLRDSIAQRKFYCQNRHLHERDECFWKEQSSDFKNKQRKLAEDHIQAIYELGYVIAKDNKDA